MSKPFILVLCVAVAIASACRSDDALQGAPSGGSSGMTAPLTGGATGGSSPIAGSGGAPIPGTGGAGGVGGVGGSTPSGGVGGVAGIDMSSGGQSASGGMGGATPMMDAGANPPSTATPSAGCNASAGRPPNGLIEAQGHYVAFPESYDGTEPMPLLLGFHGCGGVNRGTSSESTEWMRLTEGTAFATEYVRMVPLSSDAGGCWNYDNDVPKVTQAFDELLASHCIDTSRVFATGHSSGAQLVVQILLQSHASDAQHFAFKGVAPVAASDYGPMTGPIAVMYIQGMMDAERGHGDGHETVERFRAANGCGDGSMPYADVMGCQSGATSVSPGCVVYDDCDAPTVWCSHNDPQYSGTMHGVPCFGMTAMFDFFGSL